MTHLAEMYGVKTIFTQQFCSHGIYHLHEMKVERIATIEKDASSQDQEIAVGIGRGNRKAEKMVDWQER